LKGSTRRLTGFIITNAINFAIIFIDFVVNFVELNFVALIPGNLTGHHSFK